MSNFTKLRNQVESAQWGKYARRELRTIAGLITKLERGSIGPAVIAPHVSQAVYFTRRAAHYANEAIRIAEQSR